MTKHEAMRVGGQITARTLREVIRMAEPGRRLRDLDRAAESLIREAGGTPSFQTVSGYDWTTCINVNHGVVHGVPDDYELESGDLLSVDLGTFYQNYHTDLATTVVVGEREPSEEVQRFLRIGKQALSHAIDQATANNRVGDISAAIESVVNTAGYSLIRELVGHGVGKQLHESPQIPGLAKEPRDETPALKSGQGIGNRGHLCPGKRGYRG